MLSCCPSCTQVPNKEQVLALSEELRSRSELPAHVPAVLKALPQGTHPMTQFSTAVLALQARCRHPNLAKP